MDTAGKKILVCVHQRLTNVKPCCAGRGSEQIFNELQEALERENIRVPVERFLCFGLCDKGPNVRFAPGGPFFNHVAVADIPRIVEAMRAFLAQTAP